MTILRELSPEEHPIAGAVINEVKEQIQQALNAREAELKSAALNARLAAEITNVSLPGHRTENGGLHPIIRTIGCIGDLFSELGFTTTVGPEIEDDYHNFDALNIPGHHPARIDHDIFWLNTTRLLRTQTSGVQIRTIKTQQPSIRIVAPDRVYRSDYDQTHTPMLHQMEGSTVDANISSVNLKDTLYDSLHNFFKEDSQTRFRPSYFPFTEPSTEVGIMGKNGKWPEVLSCGMVHPNMLRSVGTNPEVHSGFAFRMGMKRLTMLRYGVIDLCSFFENDLRFLRRSK